MRINLCAFLFFFQMKSSIKVLKEQGPGRVEGLLNCLRWVHDLFLFFYYLLLGGISSPLDDPE